MNIKPIIFNNLIKDDDFITQARRKVFIINNLESSITYYPADRMLWIEYQFKPRHISSIRISCIMLDDIDFKFVNMIIKDFIEKTNNYELR